MAKPKTKKTSPEKLRQERAAQMVMDCKAEALEYYNEKFKLFNYFDRLYIKGGKRSNVPIGRANLELPLGFQQVEPFVSQMSETMVSEAPFIAYQGRTPDDDQFAEAITEFTQYQLESGGFLPEWYKWIRNLGKYGTGIMKIYWDTQSVTNTITEQQEVINPETGEFSVEDVSYEEEIILHDGTCYSNIPIHDFFVPKSATGPNVQKMEWVAHRTWRSPEALLSEPNYILNRNKLKILLEDSEDQNGKLNSSGGFSGNDAGKQTSLLQKNPLGGEKFSQQLEVIEWWGKFRFNDDEPMKEAVIVVVVAGTDEQFVVRLEENPFKYKFRPFVMANDYPVEGEPYGYGEMDHIKGLIEESTALRNHRLDVANLSLNRCWLIERQAGINLRDLYTAPNKVILTNDLNGIRPLDMQGVTPSSVEELARIDYDIQNTTEIINPRQDVSNVGAAFGGTATGVNFLSAKSNLRLLTKARLLQETFFKPLALIQSWYNKDYTTDQTYFRVTNDEKNPFHVLPADAFSAEVDFKPTSNPEKITSAERKENTGYLLQTLAQIEKAAGRPVTKWDELLPDVYKSLGYKHPDKYILPPQTTVGVLPNGQLVDQQGQPVQTIPLDETGKPVQAVAA